MKRILFILALLPSLLNAQPYPSNQGNPQQLIRQQTGYEFKTYIKVPILDSGTWYPGYTSDIWRRKADSALMVYDPSTGISKNLSSLFDTSRYVTLTDSLVLFVTPSQLSDSNYLQGPDTVSLSNRINLKANDNTVIHLSGNETKTGILTFNNSPIVPTPTTTGQAANKGYVDALEVFVSNTYIQQADRGVTVASLEGGKIPNSQLPAMVITETFVVNSQAAMLALSAAEQGDVAVRTDIDKSFILVSGSPSILANWQELLSPSVQNTDQVPEGTTNLYFTNARARQAVSASGDLTYNSTTGVFGYTTPPAVTSVSASFPVGSPIAVSGSPITSTGTLAFSFTGGAADYITGDGLSVALNKAAVGLANVDNTSDLSKPISTATQTALNDKAPLFSPALFGTPTTPTAPIGTNTTQIASTAFVNQAANVAFNADTAAKFIRDGGNSPAGTLNIGTNNNNAVSFQVNGSSVGAFLTTGNWRINNNVWQNSTTSNNGTITLGVTGTVIASNKANADNVATINNANTSSTGLNIASQNAGTNTFTVSRVGNVVANGQLNVGSLSTFGSNTIAPTHTITIPSVGTGWRHYNTVDQTTNTESVTGSWSANKYNIAITATGTGVSRSLGLNAGVANLTVGGTGLSGVLNLGASASTTNLSFFGITGTYSATSGVQNCFSLFPTISQNTTGGYRIIYVSPYLAEVGSGVNELMNIGSNSGSAGSGTHTSRLLLLGNGAFTSNGTTFAGTYTTSATLAGSTASIGLSTSGVDLNSPDINGYGTSERKQLTVDTSGIVKSMSMMEDTVFTATLLTPGDDASPVTIATIPIPLNGVYDIEVRVSGRQADGTDANAKMSKAILAKNVSGTVVVDGQTDIFTAIKSTPIFPTSVALSATASGSDLLIQITPSDEYIMSWKAYISIVRR